MTMSSWPGNYREQLSGSECRLCAEGRPEEKDGRIRFFSSTWSDAYLHLHGVQRGYVAVIWRGRHVVEPTELTQAEAAAFWLDLLQVGRAMQAVYRPLKRNYQLLGNKIPHPHWLVAPRFEDDVDPATHYRVQVIMIFPKMKSAGRSRCYGKCWRNNDDTYSNLSVWPSLDRSA